MADGGEIAALFATLGLRVNTAQWAQGTGQMGQAQAALGQLSAGAGTLSKLLGGVAPAAAGAGNAAARAGDQAAHSFDAAGAAIKGYLTYLAADFGYEHLVKFNQEVQDSTISLAAMIEGQLGGSFEHATGQAKELYAEWQKFSTQTPVTTAEILEFGKGLAAATFNTGGKLEDLKQITEQGVIAAKVLAGGRGAGYAALEISEMLQGNVSNRMMFVKQLLGMVHMTEDQFRELDAKGRLAVVKKALGSEAFKDAAQAFGQSFSGVTSTLKDKLQIALGKVGVPLFERITEAVGRFNEWLDKNQETIERVGKAIGEWLGDAFDGLAIAIDFVVEQGGELLDWMSQFVDGGELVKSLLIALGIVLGVFAIQSAIAFATNPITLIVLALTALVYAIRWVMQHPEKVKKAFHDAFDAIAGAARTAWEAIKSGFSAAFDFVANLPVIHGLIALVKAVADLPGVAGKVITGAAVLPSGEHAEMLQDSTELPPEEFNKKYNLPDDLDAPRLPQGSIGGGQRGPTAMNINVGDINVHSPNADPVAVGDQVRKVFHEELGGVLRQTMDVYG